ncbi:hypothetical protein RJ639_007052 [Escallonia herrerae]|uniref:Uncharacterized protein n=1 Tax=Escallonia herrerae TaxID=1293975 RepID=A0AA88VXX8_9ASTE|nr:hypothetical protein RJ639_007052 [Escallonia herrerae]
MAKMEVQMIKPPEINGIDLRAQAHEERLGIVINQVLHTSVVYMNKKRKFQTEQSLLPMPKHKCFGGGFNSDRDSPSNRNLEAEKFCSYGGVRDDESEPESAGDSNSIAEDPDSVMSVSGEAKTNLKDVQTCPYDWPSTSSVNWGGNSFKSSLYSLDSRSLTKSSSHTEKLPYIDGAQSSHDQDFDFHTSLNYEDHLLEFENESFEQGTDKGLEDIIYSNGVIPNNFVLSSGRWNAHEETQQGTKKLTIDKEFEQYFSTLML